MRPRKVVLLIAAMLLALLLAGWLLLKPARPQQPVRAQPATALLCMLEADGRIAWTRDIAAYHDGNTVYHFSDGTLLADSEAGMTAFSSDGTELWHKPHLWTPYNDTTGFLWQSNAREVWPFVVDGQLVGLNSAGAEVWTTTGQTIAISLQRETRLPSAADWCSRWMEGSRTNCMALPPMALRCQSVCRSSFSTLPNTCQCLRRMMAVWP